MTKKKFELIATAMLGGLNVTRALYEKRFYPSTNTFHPSTLEIETIKGVGYRVAVIHYIGEKSFYTPFITKSLDNALERLALNIQKELTLLADWTLESI